MNKFEMPHDPKLQGKLLQGQLEHESRRQERGLMGWIWGGGTEKPGNIAAFVIVAFVLIFAGCLIWGQESASLSKKDALTIIGGFITLALGFMFGRATS